MRMEIGKEGTMYKTPSSTKKKCTKQGKSEENTKTL